MRGVRARYREGTEGRGIYRALRGPGQAGRSGERDGGFGEVATGAAAWGCAVQAGKRLVTDRGQVPAHSRRRAVACG